MARKVSHAALALGARTGPAVYGVQTRALASLYVRRTPSRSILADSTVGSLDLAVVAFGESQTLRLQVEAMRRHLRDDWSYTTFDNSPRMEDRMRIADLCADLGVGYVSLPSNPLTALDPSGSHALALNWAYRRHLRPRGADVIGVLDPDVLPSCPTSVVDRLDDQPCWGLDQPRPPRWYLWAGFAFFRQQNCPKLDFLPMPRHRLDTGGRNWKILYRHLDRSSLRFPAHQLAPVPGQAEVIGDWVHTSNSSGWRDQTPSKEC